MGRSQLKHRTSRGRGRGGSARGGRGGDVSAKSGSGDVAKRSGGRALGSNAFRYEERGEENEGEEDEDDDLAVDAGAVPSRRQFFAGEQNYRDMGDAKESYFRTKAMQRWEADGDDEDDIETQVVTSTVGVMDFTWIEEQLRAVAPSLRYQIDPKYCVEFVAEHRGPEVVQEASGVYASTELSSPQVVAEATHAPSASALDDLLALSSSATTQSAAAAKTPAPVVLSAAPVVAAAAPPGNDAQEENLEDWLDDVLDM